MKRPLPLALAFTLGAVVLTAGPERDDARPLPFQSDDYPRALAEARARDLPLFIEAWAPW
jgi:hypothetical protein